MEEASSHVAVASLQAKRFFLAKYRGETGNGNDCVCVVCGGIFQSCTTRERNLPLLRSRTSNERMKRCCMHLSFLYIHSLSTQQHTIAHKAYTSIPQHSQYDRSYKYKQQLASKHSNTRTRKKKQQQQSRNNQEYWNTTNTTNTTKNVHCKVNMYFTNDCNDCRSILSIVQ